MVFTMIVTLTEFSAMEDAHSHVLDYGDDENAAFCAVFDGHGGSKAAKYACEHMSRMVLETPAYR
jgi:protein phosphatase 2C family protein 2/3